MKEEIMRHALKEVTSIGWILIPRWLRQLSGKRLPMAAAILKRNGKRAVAGLALLVLASLALLAGVPDENTGGRGLIVPEEWRGTWEVTVSYYDRETGALVATDVTTAAICPGELIAPPLFNTLLHLSGVANQNAINLATNGEFRL
jgi:hypothetical protein